MVFGACTKKQNFEAPFAHHRNFNFTFPIPMMKFKIFITANQMEFQKV